MITDEDRAELARWAEFEVPRWAEQMAAAQRKYRQRVRECEAIENRKRVTRMRAFSAMHHPGVPAHIMREYQEVHRKREGTDV
ncbi:hypothetical protein N4G69_22220 [Streptomyces mirabilis]|uniref:hypothetical protein n=1 Tax=Streptomyces mirabilis TaxID=68239 RepID=UPI0021C1208D|nr:hypothetical protein [Streptomyces mirabilis]MCT9108315.1 hypothetical protein [Streptomyces mirabilis]